VLKSKRKEVIFMKKTISIGLSLTLAVSLVVTAAMAWGPGFGPGFGRGSGGPAYGSPPIPNLTSEQSAQIQALRDAFLKEIEPLRNDLWTKRTELQTLWTDPKTDPAVITEKQKEIWGLQSELREKGANLALNIRNLLTPEQLAQLPASGRGAGFGPRGMGFGSPMMGPRGGC
jgi:Spy/CpxP family protein refolding chaperone